MTVKWYVNSTLVIGVGVTVGWRGRTISTLVWVLRDPGSSGKRNPISGELLKFKTLSPSPFCLFEIPLISVDTDRLVVETSKEKIYNLHLRIY